MSIEEREREFLEELISLSSQQADKEINKLHIQMEAAAEDTKKIAKELLEKDEKRWTTFKWAVSLAILFMGSVSVGLDIRMDNRLNAAEITLHEVKKRQEIVVMDHVTKDQFKAELSEIRRLIDKEHSEGLTKLFADHEERDSKKHDQLREDIIKILQEILRRHENPNSRK